MDTEGLDPASFPWIRITSDREEARRYFWHWETEWVIALQRACELELSERNVQLQLPV
jgi:hypothetical protein